MFPFKTVANGGNYSTHSDELAGNLLGVFAWIVIARILVIRRIFVNL